MVTYAQIFPQMVNPIDIAGNPVSYKCLTPSQPVRLSQGVWERRRIRTLSPVGEEGEGDVRSLSFSAPFIFFFFFF